ncbi:MAG: hypothetical protein ACOX5S_03870 [Patescibacteria group bacterium]
MFPPKADQPRADILHFVRQLADRELQIITPPNFLIIASFLCYS